MGYTIKFNWWLIDCVHCKYPYIQPQAALTVNTVCWVETSSGESKGWDHDVLISPPSTQKLPVPARVWFLFNNTMILWDERPVVTFGCRRRSCWFLSGRAAPMKVSTRRGTSAGPRCSLPRGAWEVPAPVGRQRLVSGWSAAQQVTVSF